MITDIKAQVRTALLENDELVSMVGNDKDGNVKIYQLATPYADDYPRITFSEIDNRDTHYADDEPYASQVIVQIDVWSRDSTSAMAGQVDKTMKELGYVRTSAIDFYESGPEIYHKAMRYRNSFLL